MEAGFSSRLSKRSPCISAPAGSSGTIATGTQKKDGNLHTAAVCDLLIEFEDGGTSLEQSQNCDGL
jgi:hypothetical protein